MLQAIPEGREVRPGSFHNSTMQLHPALPSGLPCIAMVTGTAGEVHTLLPHATDFCMKVPGKGPAPAAAVGLARAHRLQGPWACVGAHSHRRCCGGAEERSAICTWCAPLCMYSCSCMLDAQRVYTPACDKIAACDRGGMVAAGSAGLSKDVHAPAMVCSFASSQLVTASKLRLQV